MENSGSRYVDYTSPTAGPSGYRDDGRYSSYEDSYDPPDRPPRRQHSRERSIERLERRERSMERLNRRDRSKERLNTRERSFERLDRGDRNTDRHDRSLDRLERGASSEDRIDRRDRSIERTIERDIQIEGSLSRPKRRDRSYDRELENGSASFHHIEDRSMDRRNRSHDRLDRRERSLERGLDIRDRSMERSLDRRDGNMEVGMDRRRRSRSRDQLVVDPYPNQVYLHPGSVGHAPSERAESEFTVRNETHRSRAAEEEERRAASRAASEIYATTRFPRPQSEMSQYTYRSGRGGSDIMSVKTKTTAGGKLVMETMTAPHPCCPNTRACCCLMILLNLGLLLITLGFVVVLQLFDPPFVWYVGLSMLIFGFLVLFGSMIYCVFVCREVEKLRPPPGELYWNNHWSKTVHVPEIHYSNNQNRPADYRGSEFSYKTDRTEPSRLTAGNDTYNSMPRY